MNKSKHEPTDYFGFYNVALAAYAKTVLGANALMLGYTVAATRTMLRATAFAAPVAPAAARLPSSATSEAPVQGAPSDTHAEFAQIEASLYDDAKPDSLEAIVDEPALAEPTVQASTIEPARESLEATVSPRSNGSKKVGTRRRRGKK